MPPDRHTLKDMVPGRSPDRPEEQDHVTLGQMRDATFGTEGPADEVSLYLWRNLPAPVASMS